MRIDVHAHYWTDAYLDMLVKLARSDTATQRGIGAGSGSELDARLRLMRAEAPVDHGKAVRELGWEPRPVEESIREAARFWVGLRDAKRKSKTTS